MNIPNNQHTSSYQAKVNLASLLNDPRKVKRDYDLFTKDWGETFKDLPKGAQIRRSKYVPEVNKNQFTRYLDNTRDRFLRHQSQSLKLQKETDKSSTGVRDPSLHYSRERELLKTCAAAQQTTEAISRTRRALHALPDIFLRPDFTMQTPRVFASVLQPEDTGNESSGLRSSSKVLQEKLSHYLDMVEIALVRQISLQSDAFFKAMDSHDMLHSDLDATLNNVKKLLEKMSSIDENIVRNSLKVSRLHRFRFNSTKVMEKLQMMMTVRQTQPTIQLLLSGNEYAGALDLINTTQDVLHLELSGLMCFRHLSSQLNEMERVIGLMMRKDMEECVRNELNRPIDDPITCSNPHRLTAVTLGLLRQGQFDFLEGFRDEVEAVVKETIKSTVGEAVTSLGADIMAAYEQQVDGGEGEEPSLAARMRMLPYSDWVMLLDRVFENLIIIIKRIRSVLEVISNLASDYDRKQQPATSVKRTIKSLKKKNKNKTRSKERQRCQDEDEKAENSPQKQEISKDPSPPAPARSNNPFGDVEENGNLVVANGSNPFGNIEEEDMMEGLASYEDELISDAAEMFVSSPTKKPSVPTDNNISSENDEEEEEEDCTDDSTTEDDVCGDNSEGLQQLITTIHEIVIKTCEFQQDRCIKVIIAKGKDGSLDKLSSSEFLLLAKSVKRYTSQVEDLVEPIDRNVSDVDREYRLRKKKKLTSSLRGTLRAQAGKFVARFHDERRNKLSLILDNELWKQADVPAELYHLLRTMVDGDMTSSPTRHQRDHINGGIERSDEASEFMILKGEKFAVVGTVLIMLKMVSEYCKCCDDFPASSTDLVHRLCDLLTFFNSRTCQLVLGAGALQIVGLKTITTKNLALASRGLQLVLACLPSVREHFETRLLHNVENNETTTTHQQPQHINKISSSKTLPVLRQFDHVYRNYEDHVQEIENKLLDIVCSVFKHHLSAWQVKAPVPSTTFRAICKQLCKFHETIISLLPPTQVSSIFLELNDRFKMMIGASLSRHRLSNDGGPQHGLVTSDLGFYEKTITNLDGMEVLDLHLHTVWSVT